MLLYNMDTFETELLPGFRRNQINLTQDRNYILTYQSLKWIVVWYQEVQSFQYKNLHSRII